MLRIPQSSLLDPTTNRINETISSSKCIPLLSVSVNQIIKLFVPSIGLIVHKHLIGLVKLVGKIVDKSMEDTYITIKVNDGSHIDCLKVICYRGYRFDSNILNQGDYCKFIGKIKMETNGLPCLVVYSVSPITEFNEISIHCCEIVRDSLELRQVKNKIFKVPTVPNTSGISNQNVTTNITINNNTTETETDNNTTEVTTNPNETEGQAMIDDTPCPSTSEINESVTDNSKGPGDFLSLSGLQSSILNLLVQCKKPEGKFDCYNFSDFYLILCTLIVTNCNSFFFLLL